MYSSGDHKKAKKGPRMNLPMARNNFYVQEYRDKTWNTKLGKTSPRCSGSSNNLNLQRSRYSRLKYEILTNLNMKNGQNTDLNNQNV